MFKYRSGQEILSSPGTARPALGITQTLFEWNLSSFPWLKRPESDVDHSLVSSIKVEAEWSYTSTSSLCIYCMYRKLYLLPFYRVSVNISSRVKRYTHFVHTEMLCYKYFGVSVF